MKTKRKPFTLLELLTAMTVFTIMMLAVMRFFGLTQDVISGATEQTSQAEKVRAVMDLIATDLQNIYYEEGLDTYCFYPDGNKVDIAVYRPVIRANCKTHLVRVRYLFNSTARSLVLYSAGDDTAGNDTDSNAKWRLHLVKKAAGTIYPNNFAATDGATVLDGVYSFKMIPYEWNITDSEFKEISSFPSGTTRIPDKVRIEIGLINSETWKQYKVYDEMTMGKKITATDLEENSRIYTREVIIDRGQF